MQILRGAAHCTLLIRLIQLIHPPEKDGSRLQSARAGWQTPARSAAKAGQSALRFLRESRLEASDLEAYNVGDKIGADYFSPGEHVDVTGSTKGRGFTGIKAYHMHGVLSMTHGSHEVMRHAGSIGSSATPSRVFKGKKMAGRMGNERRTTQNLRILGVHPEENL
jgi:large subunit ribosomal protein L3